MKLKPLERKLTKQVEKAYAKMTEDPEIGRIFDSLVNLQRSWEPIKDRLLWEL